MKFIPRKDDLAATLSDGSQKDRETEEQSLELLRHVHHANLVTVFGTWQSAAALVIAMELADGTLWDRYCETVAAGLPGIPKPELAEYLWEAAKAIDYLNEPRHALLGQEQAGVQHCDIKPHNLLVIGGTVKVADLGLARVMTDQEPAKTIQATPAYASPECFLGRTSNRSDQYALGVTYCQLRGGRLPFTGNVWEIMLGHSQDPPDLTMLPKEERLVVARALAKNPEERWPDCRAFVRALGGRDRSANRCDPVWTSPDARRNVPGGPQRPLRFQIGLIVFFVALICAGLLVGVQTPTGPSNPIGSSSSAVEEPARELGRPSTMPPAMPLVVDEPLAAELADIAVEPAKQSKPLPLPQPAPLSIQPESASSCNARGEAALAEGAYDRAISIFSDALRLDADHAAAYRNRAHAYLWKSKYDQAIADYTEALRIEPRSAPAYYGRGLAFYQQGAYSNAVRSYTEAIQNKPDDAATHNGRGLAYVALGEYDRAIADFSVAIKAKPQLAEAYNNRGCAHSRKAEWDLAAADFKSAVQLDGKNPEYARNLEVVSGRKSSRVEITGIPARTDGSTPNIP
jgi:tetratricopeptide (TPR) repeat protein